MQRRIKNAFKEIRFEYTSFNASNFNLGVIQSEEVAAFILFYAKSNYLQCLNNIYNADLINQLCNYNKNDIAFTRKNLNTKKNALKQIVRFYNGVFEQKLKNIDDSIEKKQFDFKLIHIVDFLEEEVGLNYHALLLESFNNYDEFITSLTNIYELDRDRLLKIKEIDFYTQVGEEEYMEQFGYRYNIELKSEIKELIFFRLLNHCYRIIALKNEQIKIKELVQVYILDKLFPSSPSSPIIVKPDYYKWINFN